jgi:conjugative transposon TraM protein
MRLGEKAYTENGTVINKNSPVFGIVTAIDGERVLVKITHINVGGNILPFEKQVYSKDALLGIYVPGNPKSDVSKDATAGALDGLSTNIPAVDAAAQVASVVASTAANAGKQAITKNVKKIKVTIKTNYEIYLRPDEKK